MKNHLIYKTVILLQLPFFLAACSKKAPELDSQTLAALDQIDAQNALISSTKAADGSAIDYDLTKMNANMVYAQIFNLMLEPDTYADKVFRMKGNFITVPDPEGKPSYAVIVKDAQACCQQGIEFKYDFKDKVPPQDSVLLITGKFTLTETKDGLCRNFIVADSVEYME